MKCYKCGKKGSKEEFKGVMVFDEQHYLCPDCMEEFMQSDGWFDFLAPYYEDEA